jgi:hypothetical protein
MDKMTIVGSDGKPRYEIEGDKVTDVRYCDCPEQDPAIPVLTVHPPLCARCQLRIRPTPTSQEEN